MKACLRFAVPALLALALAVPSPLDACAPAPPQNVVVEVASESAIIVWDAKAKTQHFIRRATFTASAPGSVPVADFGFLVPTPSVPVLEEADDKAFDELAKVTAPRVVTQSRPSDGGGGGCIGGCGMMAEKKSDGLAQPTVEVLAAKRVGGYDAVVLKANDADALAGWLNKRGYEVRPALARWLKPYVNEKGWVVTAFKIANDPAATATAGIGTTAVRMSFAADAPFFPYREPDDMRDAKTPRLLRVFMIADQKMNGSLGAGAAWEGKTVWAGKPGAEGWKGTVPHLKIPGFAPGEDTWLTEFEDHSSPRKGDTDLMFASAADQTPVRRPDRIVYAARADGGAAPAFALLAGVALCLYLTRFLTALARK